MLRTDWNLVVDGDIKGVAITSFFFARSPVAPNITRMVSCCISSEVDMLSQKWHVNSQYGLGQLVPWMCRVIKQWTFNYCNKMVLAIL